MDMSQYYQLEINPTYEMENPKGAKILLLETEESFLLFQTRSEEIDLFQPAISRGREQDLLFIVEDLASSYHEQMRLTASGDLNVQKLKGDNTRNLVVTKDGTITTKAKLGFTDIYTVSAHDFVSVDNPGDEHNFNIGQRTTHHENSLSGSEILMASVHLPHDAIIKQINVYYIDDNRGANQDVEFTLIQEEILTSTGTFTVIDTSSGGSSALQVASKTDAFIQIDNVLYTYFINVQNPYDATDWPGDKVGIRAVSIFYE